MTTRADRYLLNRANERCSQDVPSTLKLEINFQIPRPRTDFDKEKLQYQGSVLWNRISPVLRTHPTLRDFKDLSQRERLLFSKLLTVKISKKEITMINLYFIVELRTLGAPWVRKYGNPSVEEI